MDTPDNMMNVDSSDSVDRKPKVSNLTKNLLNQSHNQNQHQQQHQQPHQQQHQSQQPHNQQSQQQHIIAQSVPSNPPGYDSINKFSNTFVPHSSGGGGRSQDGSSTLQGSSSSYNQFSSFNSDSRRESLNYIPSSHNTPNMVSSSYSSNHSYNKYNFQPSHSIPTTNVNVDNNFIPNFQRNPLTFNSVPTHYSTINQQPQPTQAPNQDNRPSSQASMASSLSHSQNQIPPHAPHLQSQMSSSNSSVNANRPAPFHQHSFTTNDHLLTNITHTPPQSLSYITEPDHYMTYSEFFNNLNAATNDEDHINIVDYPVNDLIMMLSCLLTKIIEANDKLHPNHFDTTIAIRQKLKEEKRMKKLMKQKQKEDQEPGQQSQELRPNDTRTHIESINGSNDSSINVNESVIENESSDDEEDEMKNKYLANVLAFHGTNIPGISLHAYLSRVLKYCPVTNEVFLSLLVYFDRIAKKANNLRKDNDKDSETEQLFVMDSYNIHRLIISGITVSSKFFSDIFYKNLRYAKVGGLPLEELNYLELQFLLLLDFKLMISVEDLQNYGDLLLRFWKREQITNELVNDNGNNDNSSQAQSLTNKPSQSQPMTQIPTPTQNQ